MGKYRVYRTPKKGAEAKIIFLPFRVYITSINQVFFGMFAPLKKTICQETELLL